METSANAPALGRFNRLNKAAAELVAYLNNQYWEAQTAQLLSYATLSKKALATFWTESDPPKEPADKPKKRRKKVSPAVSSALDSFPAAPHKGHCREFDGAREI